METGKKVETDNVSKRKKLIESLQSLAGNTQITISGSKSLTVKELISEIKNETEEGNSFFDNWCHGVDLKEKLKNKKQ